MSREIPFYRDEMESLLAFTDGRHLISVTELAIYDLGSSDKSKNQYIRRFYGIEKGKKYVAVSEIARQRARH